MWSSRNLEKWPSPAAGLGESQHLFLLLNPMSNGQALESSGAAPSDNLRVLVHAGAGGVGTWAVQLAKVHWKAYVVATAGPKNQSFLAQVRPFA